MSLRVGWVQVRRREWPGRFGRIAIHVDDEPTPRLLTAWARTTYELPAGAHVLRARWHLYSSRPCTVEVRAGQTVTVVTHQAYLVPFVWPLDRGLVLRQVADPEGGHGCRAH